MVYSICAFHTNARAVEVTRHYTRSAGPTTTYFGGDSSSVPWCPVLPGAEPRGVVARLGHRWPGWRRHSPARSRRDYSTRTRTNWQHLTQLNMNQTMGKQELREALESPRVEQIARDRREGRRMEGGREGGMMEGGWTEGTLYVDRNWQHTDSLAWNRNSLYLFKHVHTSSIYTININNYNIFRSESNNFPCGDKMHTYKVTCSINWWTVFDTCFYVFQYIIMFM